MRGRGEGSVRARKRRDGSVIYEARVSLDGRSRSFYGPSRSAALAKARAARADAERGLVQHRVTITVADHMADWLERVVRPSVRASTYASYASYTRSHISPRLGRIRLVDLSPAHVHAMLVDLVAGGLSEKSVHRIRSCLSGALKTAMHEYGLPRNVASLAKIPKASGRDPFRPEVITTADAKRLVASFESSRLGPLVRFSVATGLRQGELLALRWEDVDLVAGALVVHHSLDRAPGAAPALTQPKTEKSRRTVPLNAWALQALAERRRQAAADRLLAGDRWQGGEHVFANRTGGLRSGTALTKNFQEHLARHGFQRIRWHALRRAFAAVLLDRGVPITVIRDLLGHSDLHVTQHYAYTMPTALRTGVDAMNDAFGPASEAPSDPNVGTGGVQGGAEEADTA